MIEIALINGFGCILNDLVHEVVISSIDGQGKALEHFKIILILFIITLTLLLLDFSMKM